MNKIIQLSEICISLEEAMELNNSQLSAIAWVLNPNKNFIEFELVPIDKIPSSEERNDNEGIIGFRQKSGKWEIWQTEVFVSMEQINILIEKEQFFYAPLKVNL